MVNHQEMAEAMEVVTMKEGGALPEVKMITIAVAAVLEEMVGTCEDHLESMVEVDTVMKETLWEAMAAGDAMVEDTTKEDQKK